MVRVLNLLQILLFLFFSLKLACSQDLDVNDIQNSVIGPGGTACSADATEYRNFYLMKRAGEAANHVYPGTFITKIIKLCDVQLPVHELLFMLSIYYK